MRMYCKLCELNFSQHEEQHKEIQFDFRIEFIGSVLPRPFVRKSDWNKLHINVYEVYYCVVRTKKENKKKQASVETLQYYGTNIYYFQKAHSSDLLW